MESGQRPTLIKLEYNESGTVFKYFYRGNCMYKFECFTFVKLHPNCIMIYEGLAETSKPIKRIDLSGVDVEIFY